MGGRQVSRIRTIKPEFWCHEGLSDLPEATHLLAAALLNYADDEGYFNANPKLVQATCSPLREPSVSIPESLRSLQTIGYIRLGRGHDGKQYGQIVKFSEHQRVSHPTPSKISKLSITWECSGNPPEPLWSSPEVLRPEMEQGTGNREQGINQSRAIPSDAGLVRQTHQGRKKQAVRHEYSEAFERTWSSYPSRSGNNSKADAYRTWKARVRQGVSPDELHAGVVRYARYVSATGKEGTEYVKQAATFFGPGEHWREPWSAAPRSASSVGTAAEGDW